MKKKDKAFIITAIILALILIAGMAKYLSDIAKSPAAETSKEMTDPTILNVPTDGTVHITKGSDIEMESSPSEEISVAEDNYTENEEYVPYYSEDTDPLQTWYGTYIENQTVGKNYYLVATWNTSKNHPNDFLAAYLAKNASFYSETRLDDGFVAFSISKLEKGMYQISFCCDATEEVIDAHCVLLTEDEYDTYIRRWEGQRTDFETAEELYASLSLKEYFDSVISYPDYQFYEIDTGITKDRYKTILAKNARNNIYSYVEW